MISDFSKRQRSILDLIIRLSYGCEKEYAHIPIKRDFQTLAGIPEQHIKKELNRLAEDGVIIWDEDKCEYSINDNFGNWKVPLIPHFSPERLQEVVKSNLASEESKAEFNEILNNCQEDLSNKLDTIGESNNIPALRDGLNVSLNNSPISPEGDLKPAIRQYHYLNQQKRTTSFVSPQVSNSPSPKSLSPDLMSKVAGYNKLPGHEPPTRACALDNFCLFETDPTPLTQTFRQWFWQSFQELFPRSEEFLNHQSINLIETKINTYCARRVRSGLCTGHFRPCQLTIGRAIRDTKAGLRADEIANIDTRGLLPIIVKRFDEMLNKLLSEEIYKKSDSNDITDNSLPPK